MHFHVLSHDSDEFSKWCPELGLSFGLSVWKPWFDLSLTSIWPWDFTLGWTIFKNKKFIMPISNYPESTWGFSFWLSAGHVTPILIEHEVLVNSRLQLFFVTLTTPLRNWLLRYYYCLLSLLLWNGCLNILTWNRKLIGGKQILSGNLMELGWKRYFYNFE